MDHFAGKGMDGGGIGKDADASAGPWQAAPRRRRCSTPAAVCAVLAVVCFVLMAGTFRYIGLPELDSASSVWRNAGGDWFGGLMQPNGTDGGAAPHALADLAKRLRLRGVAKAASALARGELPLELDDGEIAGDSPPAVAAQYFPQDLRDTFQDAASRYASAHARILAWTPVSGRAHWEGFRIDFCPELGARQCVVTHERTLRNRASALLFSSTDLDARDMPRTRDVRQPWVLYSEVSPVELPPPYHALRPEIARNFDYTMTYRLDSDFPIPAFGAEVVDALAAPVSRETVDTRFRLGKRGGGFLADAVLIAGATCDTDNQRLRLAHALDAHGISVDVLGSCTAPQGGQTYPLPESEIEFLTKLGDYKFVLVLETSNCQDYVSRNLLRAFQAGVLPIVDGPGSYSAFIPGPKAVLHALGMRRNASPQDKEKAVQDLAKTLAALAEDQDAYYKFVTASRAVPESSQWAAFWRAPGRALGRRSGWCGLCATALRSEDELSAVRAKRRAYASYMDAEDAKIAEQLEKINGERSALGLHNVSHDHLRGTWPLPRSPLALVSSDMIANPKIGGPPIAPVALTSRMVSPDYSCRLGAWRDLPVDSGNVGPASTLTRAHYSGALPDDFVRHVFTNYSADLRWPRPLRRKSQRISAHAILGYPASPDASGSDDSDAIDPLTGQSPVPSATLLDAPTAVPEAFRSLGGWADVVLIVCLCLSLLSLVHATLPLAVRFARRWGFLKPAASFANLQTPPRHMYRRASARN